MEACPAILDNFPGCPQARADDRKAAGKAFGMPTTVIVDPSGCEIGTMAGPAEWASDDGVKLVSAVLARR